MAEDGSHFYSGGVKHWVDACVPLYGLPFTARAVDEYLDVHVDIDLYRPKGTDTSLRVLPRGEGPYRVAGRRALVDRTRALLAACDEDTYAARLRTPVGGPGAADGGRARRAPCGRRRGLGGRPGADGARRGRAPGAAEFAAVRAVRAGRRRGPAGPVRARPGRRSGAGGSRRAPRGVAAVRDAWVEAQIRLLVTAELHRDHDTRAG